MAKSRKSGNLSSSLLPKTLLCFWIVFRNMYQDSGRKARLWLQPVATMAYSAGLD